MWDIKWGNFRYCSIFKALEIGFCGLVLNNSLHVSILSFYVETVPLSVSLWNFISSHFLSLQAEALGWVLLCAWPFGSTHSWAAVNIIRCIGLSKPQVAARSFSPCTLFELQRRSFSLVFTSLNGSQLSKTCPHPIMLALLMGSLDGLPQWMTSQLTLSLGAFGTMWHLCLP